MSDPPSEVARGEGATKTRIVGSHLHNDLIIDNGAGFDILVVYDASIDGDAVVTSGDGGSRTTFGIEEDPIVWGDLFITNLDAVGRGVAGRLTDGVTRYSDFRSTPDPAMGLQIRMLGSLPAGS